MSSTNKVLVLVTNHSTLGDTEEANGTYAPEITHAIDVFNKYELEYDIASIKGGAAPLYGEDTEGDDVNRRVLSDNTFSNKISNTLAAETLSLDDYCAVFYPGGFGLLSDLADNEAVAKQTAQLFEKGAVVGAVCHGPAGLLPVKLSNGEHLISNIAVTGFTREEEVEFGTIDKIPYLLEEKLTRTAGQYVKKAPWAEFVVTEDRVITGQNPASAHAVAEAMVARLRQA